MDSIDVCILGNVSTMELCRMKTPNQIAKWKYEITWLNEIFYEPKPLQMQTPGSQIPKSSV